MKKFFISLIALSPFFVFVSPALAAQLTLQAVDTTHLSYSLRLNANDISEAGLYQENSATACTDAADCNHVFIHLVGQVEEGCTGIQTDCGGSSGSSAWEVYSPAIITNNASSSAQTGTITLPSNYLNNV